MTLSETLDDDGLSPVQNAVCRIDVLEPGVESYREEVLRPFIEALPAITEDLIDTEMFGAPMEIRRRRYQAARTKEAKAAVIEECRLLAHARWHAFLCKAEDRDGLQDDDIETLIDLQANFYSGRLEVPVLIKPFEVGAFFQLTSAEAVAAMIDAAHVNPGLDVDAIAAIIEYTAVQDGQQGIVRISAAALAKISGLPDPRVHAAITELRATKGLVLVDEIDDELCWDWVPHKCELAGRPEIKAWLANMKREIDDQIAAIKAKAALAGLGHNSQHAAPEEFDEDADAKPSAFDPGPDKAYDISKGGLSYPDHVDKAALKAFEACIASQGDETVRQKAVKNAYFRVRPVIGFAAFKLYSIISGASKGARRCCLWGFDDLVAHGGFTDRAQVSRLLKELEDDGHVAVFRFPLTPGNSRTRAFIAPTITAGDRLGASITLVTAKLKQQMEAARAKEAARLRDHRAKKSAARDTERGE